MAINTNYSNSYDKSQNKATNYLFPLININLLFFVFGFITSMNDVLIPKLKSAFTLSYFQSMLIQFCFFFAYFIASLVYYILSVTKGDPILKIGYKNTIIFGFLISALGSALFYPASMTHSYPLFLLALFILASGFAILQISANPYVTLLGSPKGASGRLNLTQSFNSLGTTIAPLIGGKLILDSTLKNLENPTESLKAPYIIITIALLLMALLIRLSYLPKINNSKNKKDFNFSRKNLIPNYRQLKYGIGGIFMYVGAEVSIGSLIVSYISELGTSISSESQAAKFLALYWGGAMIGRFFGAIFLSNAKNKNILILITFLGAIYYSFFVMNYELKLVLPYWILISLNLVSFFIGKNLPARTLSIFSFASIIALLIGVFTHSFVGIWAIISIGLFNSIMFPTIFSLSIRDLKDETSRGSYLLIMAIVGGAIIPLLQGSLADLTHIRYSYLIPTLCYLYILFFSLKGHKEYQKK